MAAEARLAQDEQEEGARRSMISTAPSDPPSAPQVWLSDMPGWCVDLGPTLRAMSACELWLAIARGDVTAETKVWREGMAYWEPAARVPEFALALPEVTVWSSRRPEQLAEYGSSSAFGAPESAGDGGVRRGAELEATGDFGDARAHMHAPADPRGAEEVVRVVTLAAPGDFVTPAPVVVEHEDPPPASIARSKWVAWLDRRAALSVTAGALLAITALALATTGPAPAGEPSHPGARPAAAAVGPETLLFGGASPMQPRSGEEMSPVWNTPSREAAPEVGAPPAGVTSGRLSPVKQRAPRGPRAADRGQRRVRGAAR